MKRGSLSVSISWRWKLEEEIEPRYGHISMHMSVKFSDIKYFKSVKILFMHLIAASTSKASYRNAGFGYCSHCRLVSGCHRQPAAKASEPAVRSHALFSYDEFDEMEYGGKCPLYISPFSIKGHCDLYLSF